MNSCNTEINFNNQQSTYLLERVCLADRQPDVPTCIQDVLVHRGSMLVSVQRMSYQA